MICIRDEEGEKFMFTHTEERGAIGDLLLEFLVWNGVICKVHEESLPLQEHSVLL